MLNIVIPILSLILGLSVVIAAASRSCRSMVSGTAHLAESPFQTLYRWTRCLISQLSKIKAKLCDMGTEVKHRLTSHPTKDSQSETRNDVYAPVNLDVLNCRARIGRQPQGDCWQTVIIIEVCGIIEAPDDEQEVDLEITIADVTEGTNQPIPALNRPKHGSIQHAQPFRHRTEMGKLCHQISVLEDWTAVAQLSPEWFVLGRSGHRNLQYNLSILARTTENQLAATACIAPYEAIEVGYLDIEDNIERARTLAVGLAFSVAIVDDTLSDPGVVVIGNWVTNHFGTAHASPTARRELERALQKTTTFFQRGGRLNLADICAEIAEIAPMVGRLEILSLCLGVSQAKGQVTAIELSILKDLSDGMQIDSERFHAMVDKTLPIDMHDQENSEMVLGITKEMDPDEARRQLNRQYAKWSSRVISSDPAIRKQADQMLKLIAETRTQYVGAKCVR